MSSEILLTTLHKVPKNCGFVLNLADFVESLALSPPQGLFPRAGALFERCKICATRVWHVVCRALALVRELLRCCLARELQRLLAQEILIIHLMNFWFWRTPSHKRFLSPQRERFLKKLLILTRDFCILFLWL